MRIKALTRSEDDSQRQRGARLCIHVCQDASGICFEEASIHLGEILLAHTSAAELHRLLAWNDEDREIPTEFSSVACRIGQYNQ